MPDHDPNGEAWEDWKRAGYDSYETFIESKAGACPPYMDEAIRRMMKAEGWPMPKPPPFLADDENDETPHA